MDRSFALPARGPNAFELAVGRVEVMRGGVGNRTVGPVASEVPDGAGS